MTIVPPTKKIVGPRTSSPKKPLTPQQISDLQNETIKSFLTEDAASHGKFMTSVNTQKCYHHQIVGIHNYLK